MTPDAMSVAAPRPAHRPSRIDDVVEAAIRVFSRKGLANSTMADLAEACGMGPGAVYYHFPKKEDLFAAAVRRVAEDIADITGRGREAPGTIPEVVRSIYDWIAANPDKARLLFLAAPGSTPEIAENWSAFVEEHVRGLYRYVPTPRRSPSAVGHGWPQAEDLAARTAIVTANAVAMAYLSGDVFGRRASRDRVADAVATVMVRLMPEARTPAGPSV